MEKPGKPMYKVAKQMQGDGYCECGCEETVTVIIVVEEVKSVSDLANLKVESQGPNITILSD